LDVLFYGLECVCQIPVHMGVSVTLPVCSQRSELRTGFRVNLA
jgi:hypothetical protein